MRRLFEVLTGPLAQPATRGVRFGPFRTGSFDGCSSIKLPDSVRNTGRFSRQSHGGYPNLELMTLVETGTRSLIGRGVRPHQRERDRLRPPPAAIPAPRMLVLWDKGFDAHVFLATVPDTERSSCDACAPTAAPRL
ncbi:hypothetical protein ACFWSF_19085 [Streptomyces sp. NPDC058611]|uniref:hypothetical protein n=1 Tax=unclassified Streptomyces TaxID=2593676 RepID=UPI00364BA761